jgi:hypothetical protein
VRFFFAALREVEWVCPREQCRSSHASAAARRTRVEEAKRLFLRRAALVLVLLVAVSPCGLAFWTFFGDDVKEYLSRIAFDSAAWKTQGEDGHDKEIVAAAVVRTD